MTTLNRTILQTDENKGFTLIEIMVALAIISIVTGAAVVTFSRLQANATAIDQQSTLAVNARGAIYFIEDNIRLAGFNPKQDMNSTLIIQKAGMGEMIFKRNDLNNLNDEKTIRIKLNSSGDPDGDGIAESGATSLVIDNQNIADDIVAIGFGYAFDSDENGSVNLSANSNVIWAVDTDGDGTLDGILDSNDDGIVDESDDSPPGSITTLVNKSKIRAVKIWLLTRTHHPVKGHNDTTTYAVGGNRVTPGNSHIHVLHTTTIRGRNL